MIDRVFVQMLVSTLIYRSSDMQSIWKTLTEGIDGLTLPTAVQVQLFAMDFPGMERSMPPLSLGLTMTMTKAASSSTRLPASAIAS